MTNFGKSTNKKCNNCNHSSFKKTTILHSIKTRDENRGTLNIENLPVKECNICGHVVMPERSEEIIDTVKHIVQQEMERAVAKEKETSNEAKYPFPSFLTFLKRLIG